MLLALALAAALLVGLGEAFGYVRAAAALVVGWGMLYLGFSYFRSAGQAAPDPGSQVVEDQDLRYVCTMCGLQLKVEVATNERAPTHCREKMELFRGPAEANLAPPPRD